MSVVPFRRPGPPSASQLRPVRRNPAPVRIVADFPVPEPSGAGSMGVIVWVAGSCFCGFCLGIGLLVWALWP